MDKRGLFFAYFNMPEASLVRVLNGGFKEYANLRFNIMEDWIDKKKCKCSENYNIQNRRIILECKHIQKELLKKTKEKEKKLNFKSDVLRLRNFIGIKRVLQRFHTL